MLTDHVLRACGAWNSHFVKDVIEVVATEKLLCDGASVFFVYILPWSCLHLLLRTKKGVKSTIPCSTQLCFFLSEISL
ncbi:hypothetical protein Y032_0006g3073 [Ancylostoma ceylanicum]|uniref:Uncharacterized protein n=1 Tax=Ancylostoma ceylanicum TaxID=53326 RepID=A0A016VQN1_9BILA|nr:hypothetical protein Y032_0006g3073 [Ancylostoma ceylanicum]